MKKINGIVSLLIATFSISATAQFSNCVYLASDVYPGSYGSLPTNMTLFNGVVYFGCTGSMAGNELWKYCEHEFTISTLKTVAETIKVSQN